MIKHFILATKYKSIKTPQFLPIRTSTPQSCSSALYVLTLVDSTEFITEIMGGLKAKSKIF